MKALSNAMLLTAASAFSLAPNGMNLREKSSRIWANDKSSLNVDVVCIPGSDPNRPQKVNQDAYFVSREIGDICVGVLDGHGLKGHLLNEYLSDKLPVRIKEQLNDSARVTELEEQIRRLAHLDLSPTDDVTHEALINAFHQVHWDASQDEGVPAGRSGSTCVVCLVDKANLTVAHVGDSRAILLDKTLSPASSSFAAGAVTPLCVETTVSNFDSERERIENCEGRIDGAGNVFYGPVGIAMTRSLGNAVMLRAGIVPTPMVTTFDRPCDGAVLVLATDGIWDVLSNEAVAHLVAANPENASQAIADAARKKWIGDLPIVEEKVDDITCLVLRL